MTRSTIRLLWRSIYLEDSAQHRLCTNFAFQVGSLNSIQTPLPTIFLIYGAFHCLERERCLSTDWVFRTLSGISVVHHAFQASMDNVLNWPYQKRRGHLSIGDSSVVGALGGQRASGGGKCVWPRGHSIHVVVGQLNLHRSAASQAESSPNVSKSYWGGRQKPKGCGIPKLVEPVSWENSLLKLFERHGNASAPLHEMTKQAESQRCWEFWLTVLYPPGLQMSSEEWN